MISVKNVSKSFGSVKALKDVSFDIRSGEVVGLLGPNGAGKTTMMRIIAGFFPASTGEILIENKLLDCTKVKLHKLVGYLAEHNPLYKDMTTKEFLSYVATLKGLHFKAKRHSIRHVVEQCAIGDVQNRLIGKLSKGFQQRIGIAQSLLGDPKLLILDEPTSGLDPQQIIGVRHLIKTLSHERTVLLSTHILPEVRATCQSILILNKGAVVARGNASDLESKLKGFEEFEVSLKGPHFVGQKHLEAPGVVEVRLIRGGDGQRDYLIVCEEGKDIRSLIAKQILEAGFELIALKPIEWNLEDIFLKVVTQESTEVLAC